MVKKQALIGHKGFNNNKANMGMVSNFYPLKMELNDF